MSRVLTFKFKNMKTRIVVLLLSLLPSIATLAQNGKPAGYKSHEAHTTADHAKPTGKMLLISDMHFNPFCDPSLMKKLTRTDYRHWEQLFESATDTSFGLYGSDTYYRLLKSSLNAMTKQNPKPDMIVITGDFISHDFETDFQKYVGSDNQDSLRSFIRKTTAFAFLMLKKHFPNTIILPVLGNNDDYCGDYHIQPSGPYLKFFAEQTLPLLGRVRHPDFMSTFSKGGYYKALMPWDTTQVFIGLNTIFFSAKYENTCNPSDKSEPGWEEFDWLKATLADCAAHHKNVWMAYHIPPGIDVYASLDSLGGCKSTTTGMWGNDYNDSFLALVTRYSGIIKANFAGHTHMDDFRLIGAGDKAVSFIHIAPAVSPIFGNNPAFQEATWDRQTMQLTNAVTYKFSGIQTYGKNTWDMEYDYNKTYGTTSISAGSLHKVWETIGSDPNTRVSYMKYFFVSDPKKIPSPWRAYWCGDRYLTIEGFRKCNCGK